MTEIKDLTLQDVKEFLASEEKRSDEFSEDLKVAYKIVLESLGYYANRIISFLERTKKYDEKRKRDGIAPVMNIKSKGDWIPCKVKMPLEKKGTCGAIDHSSMCKLIEVECMISDYVSVTVLELNNGKVFVSTDHTIDGKWSLYPCEDGYKVTAWQPRPEPYSGE